MSLTPVTQEVVKLAGNGERYENKKLTGRIEVTGENVTIKNDEIITTGTCGSKVGEVTSLSECTSQSILALGNGLTVSHVKMGGSEAKGRNAVEECAKIFATGLTMEYDRIENCGGIKPDGGGTIAHNYALDNLVLSEEHYEPLSDDTLVGTVSPPIIIKENTFLNPHNQTAAIFLQGASTTEHGAEAHGIGEVRIENNFLAGGGYLIYGAEQPEENRPPVGKEIITGNRFARACHGNATVLGEYGHHYCAGQTEIAGNDGTLWTTMGDGYYPFGGSYGIDAYMGKNLTWSGNYWDDNKEPAGP